MALVKVTVSAVLVRKKKTRQICNHVALKYNFRCNDVVKEVCWNAREPQNAACFQIKGHDCKKQLQFYCSKCINFQSKVQQMSVWGLYPFPFHIYTPRAFLPACLVKGLFPRWLVSMTTTTPSLSPLTLSLCIHNPPPPQFLPSIHHPTTFTPH